nr:hypothetical protein KK1_038316 [Ipomoea batatas]GME21509.1 hypothetical protein KK1_038316 [Ipomoea batatas]
MVTPSFVLVVDNSSSKAPGWVDSGAGDRNSGKVNHEHRKSNWERLTGDTGGAVNEDEDHATESPSNSKNAHTAARVSLGVGGLTLVPNHSQHCNVKEKKGGYELSYDSSVKRPLGQLHGVDERRRRRIVVVLGRK